NLIQTNLSLKKAYGLNPDDLVKMNLRDLVSERYRDQIKDYLKSIIEKGKDNGFMNVQTKDGRRIIIEYNNTLISNESGPEYVQGSGKDITERLNNEQALKESEERYKALFDRSLDCIFIHDNRGNFIDANDAALKVLGYNREEMLSVNFVSLLSEDQFPLTLQVLEELKESDQQKKPVEYRLKHKNGGYVDIEAQSSVIYRHGKPYAIQGIARDITQRKQAEVKIKESEEKYRNILENIDDGYFEVDIFGNFIFFNDSMCRILGYPKDELMGMNNREYMDEKNAKKIYQVYNEIYRTGIPAKVLDWKFIRKDGSGCFAETVVSLITDSNDKRIGFRGIARDVTNRKQLEAQLQQAQKMEAIGTLAGGISHDFNNILSSIIGFTELALDDVEKGTPLEENLQEVFTAGIRAKDLIGQILTLSRHSAMEFKPILINSVVKETVKMLRSTIPTSINFQGNICDRQLVVHADPTQIQQVIINLATNAKHAMSETGGVLMIDVDPVSFDESTENINLIPGNYARITVSDTGTGVNKDHLEKIFEPYFTTKAAGEGSGLGLSVVHGIVKSHKGDIAVCSEPGKGTKVHVCLPLSEHQSIEFPATTAEPLLRGTEHILIVDDEPSIVKMQQRSLERLGYSVTTRTSSVNALETFCATPDKYVLVITDMTMPDMTGDKLADEIKKIRPDVPVILCTGFSDNIKIRTGPDLQIDEFISKPID
ncbi:MAG: PAS domain S-box protein, partial [Desulfobacteraceae bacterium]|nr:PAS domain S-box protein [Desulfobacteraceae bacterium]